ncbi:hypothetical protein BD413DRAFT_311298 [Trametes elegans]|nr:hypothetical protein BD413DRAFT_311298 [Trametes elegans]
MSRPQPTAMLRSVPGFVDVSLGVLFPVCVVWRYRTEKEELLVHRRPASGSTVLWLLEQRVPGTEAILLFRTRSSGFLSVGPASTNMQRAHCRAHASPVSHQCSPALVALVAICSPWSDPTASDFLARALRRLLIQRLIRTLNRYLSRPRTRCSILFLQSSPMPTPASVMSIIPLDCCRTHATSLSSDCRSIEPCALPVRSRSSDHPSQSRRLSAFRREGGRKSLHRQANPSCYGHSDCGICACTVRV